MGNESSGDFLIFLGILVIVDTLYCSLIQASVRLNCKRCTKVRPTCCVDLIIILLVETAAAISLMLTSGRSGDFSEDA